MPEQQTIIEPNLPPNAAFIAEIIATAGGRPVLIGGAVRDRLLGLPVKDIDIEVFGLSMDKLIAVLQPIATVHAVGKSFGILKVNCRGQEIDVSLPRRERKAGQGHRGFEVQSDPYMPFWEAASRRDFTINAIGIDLISHEMLDPWRGMDDLRHGIIRHITDAFDEDPLRVLRACQFAARFEFTIAPETLQKCRSLRNELASLSRERIWEEIKKVLLKSCHPSLGITALVDTGGIVLFPELAEAHDEIDKLAWEMHNSILDNAANLCRNVQLPDETTLALLLAALCLRFLLLSEASLKTESFLQHSGCPISFLKKVPPLTTHAYQPFELWRQLQNAIVPAGVIRRLALHAPIRDLCLLATAIAAANPQQPQNAAIWLHHTATCLGVAEAAPKPLLLGRHLQGFGLAPGSTFKPILDLAYEAQLDGQFDNEAQGIAWLRNYLEQQ